MASFNLKKHLPTILIIGAFLLISWLYAYPALSGKELSQGDNINWKGMSHEADLEAKKTGEPVLWTNSMFGGMPTYTFYLGKTANYMWDFEQVIQKALPKPGYFFFLAMLGFYIFMRALNVNRWLSGIGAFAYAFATYNPVIIAAGHDTKMLSLAYLPATLGGLLFLFEGKYLKGAVITGIAFSLFFMNQHVQILFYFGLIAIAMGICLLVIAIRQQRLPQFFKAAGIAIAVMIVGSGPAMPQFLSTLDYAKYSIRGGQSELTFNHDPAKKSGGLDKNYAFQWSNSIGETWCILVPYLYGGGSGEDASNAPATSEAIGGTAEKLPTYWGPQPFLSGPVYFGAIVCFLFVLGLMVVRSPHKWWIAAVSFLAILMSWGKHLPGFNYWLFDNIPVMNKLRTPSMVLIIPQLLFPMLGIWAVQDILRNYSAPEARAALAKKVLIAAGITAGLALIVGVGGSAFFNFTDAQKDQQYAQILSYLKEDREAMARKSGLLSAFYIAVAGGLIWAYLKNIVKANVMTIGLGLLIIIDLLPVSWRYLNDTNYNDPEEYSANFQPRPVDQQVYAMAQQAGDGEYYRVLDVTKDVYNDATQAYFHKCVGGYNPAKLEIYQDLIDVHLSKGFNAQVLNMLNTKYLIVPAGQQGQAQVIPNPSACGNAWFVSNIREVPTADAEMLAMNAPALGDTVMAGPETFNPHETAIVRKDFAAQLSGLQPGRDSAASVKLAKYGLNQISYTSNSSREGLAIFSDIWYPAGWKAYVDGKETPIVRANYVLRGLRLPAGQHRIEFKFHPKQFYTGNTIAGISSLLLFGLLAVGIVAAVRSAGKDDTEPGSREVKA
jgi:hypothetical protein